MPRRSPHTILGRRRAVAAVLLLAVLAACSGGQGSGTTGEEVDPAEDLGTKPDAAAQLPDDRGDPPDELVIEDLVVGDGEQADSGEVVEVHYVGVTWSQGAEFDASWDRGDTFSFELGAGRVIEGWDRGVEGMAVGGRRVLIIPPDLAYGERGAGELIGPGATLLFVVDLVAVGDDPAAQ